MLRSRLHVEMAMRARKINVAAVLAALAACLLLAGCVTSTFDAEETRLCRLVAATLGPPGSRIEVLAQNGRRLEDGLGIARIDVLAHPPKGAPRRDFVVCRFRRAPGAAPDLIAVSTERGPMSPIAMHLLRRHWLANPEAALEDPAPFGPTATPRAPRWAALAIQHAANALPASAVAALLAGAYALVYGLIGRINLAFGELAAAAGYAAFYGLAFLRGSAAAFAAALALAMTAAAAYGLACARLVFLPLRRASGFQTLVATVGLATFLQEYLRLAQGASQRFAPPFPAPPIPLVRSGAFVATASPVALICAFIALGVALATLAALRRARFGREWRASAQDPLAAQLFGVAPTAIFLKTFLLASTLAGLAGFLMTLQFGRLDAGAATRIGLSALAGAVLGGVGSVGGAMLGGGLIGAFGALWSALFPIAYRDVAVYVILALTLALRPQGLFGDADEAFGRRPAPQDRPR